MPDATPPAAAAEEDGKGAAERGGGTIRGRWERGAAAESAVLSVGREQAVPDGRTRVAAADGALAGAPLSGPLPHRTKGPGKAAALAAHAPPGPRPRRMRPTEPDRTRPRRTIRGAT
ncbi:hypothetical protein GCM10023224_45520 [Streptomonospora halophila]|uniref:Uncharacterized protein n=1 Tax=Streptomonospora halophila TaxID=427369 RepID=A0ABP9GXC9_9ACTN